MVVTTTPVPEVHKGCRWRTHATSLEQIRRTGTQMLGDVVGVAARPVQSAGGVFDATRDTELSPAQRYWINL